MAVLFATLLSTQTVLAADNLPFTYTVDFKVNLRGRDMTSDTGDFCNTWKSTFVENKNLDKNIWIQLYKVGFPADDPVGVRVSYAADGANHVFCWRGFAKGPTYFFRYTKNNNTFTIRGSGTVNAG